MMRFFLSAIAFLLPVLPVCAADPAPVTVLKSETTIDFLAGKELITRYHIGPEVAKPYFWPLSAPEEIPVTRAWPMQKGLPNESTDHVHQKSKFCHGDVIPEGIELKVHSADKHVKGVDFWSEGKGHGQIVCVTAESPKTTGNEASVVTKNGMRWTKILDEERTIIVRNLGDARLVELNIDLLASACPITFGNTKEGSMGVRVNDAFRLTAPKSDGIVTSS